MSNRAFGATITRLFDPDTTTHMALSEDAHLELRMLFEAMAAVHQVMDTPPNQTSPEIEPHHIAPLFYTFAAHGQRIIAETPTHFPHKPGRKSA